MIRALAILLSLLSLLSCSSHVKLSTSSCKTSGLWTKSSQHDFNFTKNITIYGDSETILVKKALADENIFCENLESLEMSISKSWLDSLFIFIPFVSKFTLNFKGSFNNRVKEDSDFD